MPRDPDLSLPSGADPARLAALLTRLVGPSDIMVSLADARRPDLPLVYVNDAFCRGTGYAAHEVIGRNCRFLQGPGTDPVQVARIREALAGARAAEVELVNYRKDGAAFVNLLRLSPVFGADGAPDYVLGSQLDLSARREGA